MGLKNGAVIYRLAQGDPWDTLTPPPYAFTILTWVTDI